MKTDDKYVDRHYHFKGKWDVPGLCGLKIVRKAGQTVVIATNLYDENPGTSISRWSAQLADSVCRDFDIPPGELLFIERNPDIHSRLAFYQETFDIVSFDRVDGRFANPVWKRISHEEVDELTGK